MATDPSLDYIGSLETFVDSRVAQVQAIVAAKVSSYDHTTKRATVVPIVQVGVVQTDGSIAREEPLALANVPVAELGSSVGGFAITFPLSAGDEGLLLVNNRSLAEYLQTGADSTEPASLQRWSMRDALFLPVFFREAQADDRASGVVVVKGTELRLGSSTASDYVALATKTSNRVNTLVTQIDAMKTVFNAHTHGGVLPGGSVTTAPGVPQVGPTSTVPGDFAATKVKAE